MLTAGCGAGIACRRGSGGLPGWQPPTEGDRAGTYLSMYTAIKAAIPPAPTAVIKFSKGLFHTQTTSGPRDLGKLILGVDVHAQKSSSPLPEKGFCYHGTGRPSTYGIETEAEVLGKEIRVSFHKQVDSDELSVTITKQKT